MRDNESPEKLQLIRENLLKTKEILKGYDFNGFDDCKEMKRKYDHLIRVIWEMSYVIAHLQYYKNLKDEENRGP